MNPCEEEISLGKLIFLLLETGRFNSSKCIIYDDSKPILINRVGYIKNDIANDKLDKLSNLQYLYNFKVKEFHIKGFLKNKLEITISTNK